MSRRIVAAAFGVALGIVTLPLAVFVWPANCAWFFWHEAEEGGVDDER